MPEVLSVVDVFMLTSHVEANPAAVLEAMACEKPVVATDVGSVSETVLDGKTGYLVPPGDPESLAWQTVELLCHPDRAAVMGRAGREQVIAHWSVERMVHGYEDLIAEIYEAKAAASGTWAAKSNAPWQGRIVAGADGGKVNHNK